MNRSNSTVYERVRGFVETHSLISPHDNILLSLSAGKDSMALLDIMMQLQGYVHFDLGIFHLNHMMRGGESDGDEDFLKGVAQENGLRIFIRRYDFKKNMPVGESFEDFARRVRYDLLFELCMDNGFQKIATGHSLDDNGETVLMRIFSGTGIYGLSGIRPKRGNIIRPLLILSSEDIYRHLIAKNIHWREDSSNKDSDYQRNYVRNILMPKVAERFTNAGNAINLLSRIAGEHVDLIDTLIEKTYGRVYEKQDDGVLIDVNNFIHDESILKHILIKTIKECYNYYISSGMLQEVYKNLLVERSNALLYRNQDLVVRKTLKDGRKYILISDCRNHEHGAIEDYEYRVAVAVDSVKELFIEEIDLGITIDVVDYSFFRKNLGKRNFIFVTLDKDIDYIIIRNRRNGDRIKLEMGSKKIKDLMIEKKLDPSAKSRIPLLVIRSQIAAFMPGLMDTIDNRVSPDFWVNVDSKKILAIYWVGN